MNHYQNPCLARDWKSPSQRRIFANIFSEKVDLARSLPQTACLSSEVNKYTAELSFGSSHNTLLRGAQMSTEICILLFTRRRIKCWDRGHSVSISLHFYQTILESSLQTRFMFDIDKLLLIDALTLNFIPGETQDHLLRIAINLLQFSRILLYFYFVIFSPATTSCKRPRPLFGPESLTIF